MKSLNIPTDLNDVVFFDGVCVLCNGAVKLLIQIDKQQRLRYALIQGQYAQSVLSSPQIESVSSMILQSQGISYEKAEAVIQVLNKLGGVYRLLSLLLKIFPIFVLNGVYNFIARNRYSFFGKNDSCFIPKEQHKKLFLP